MEGYFGRRLETGKRKKIEKERKATRQSGNVMHDVGKAILYDDDA